METPQDNVTQDISGKNKRIAKNTLLLYFRMILLLGINLYTSRVILRVLGVVDYGIFNVVGGVIAMLGFITSSLGGASSRYITFNLGKGEVEKMQSTFGNIMAIHLVTVGIILLGGLTIGLWFVLTQLQIPSERMNAAIWVYLFSILTSIIVFLTLPFNSVIIAHEKMSVFAYLSIVDAFLQLLVVFALQVIPLDKLAIYAFLLVIVKSLIGLGYVIYCRRNFFESRTWFAFDRSLFKEILFYAGWTMNGTLAIMGYTQGLNILLNIFFGPAVNAARALAVQVEHACRQFCTNFQMALNPQLTKSYARGELEYMHTLLVKSSKFSFYIVFLLVMPLMFEAYPVLKIWLGNVPEHTSNFLRLILIPTLSYTLANPLIVSVHATGKIKWFQIIEGTILLSIVPIAYFVLKFTSLPPEIVFVVYILVEFCAQVARAMIVLPMIQMDIIYYIKTVAQPIALVCLLSPIIPFVVNNHLSDGLSSYFSVGALSVLCTSIVIYFIGCTRSERFFLLKKLKVKR